MKHFLARLDLTTIAYVAAMVVLLSTIILIAPVSTFAQGAGDAGDGDGDGDGGGNGYGGNGYGGNSYNSYIEANIKQIQVKATGENACSATEFNSAMLDSYKNDMVRLNHINCTGVTYVITLTSGLTVSFVRLDAMSLSEFYSSIRSSGFVGEMSLLMELLNKVGKVPGTYPVKHSSTGFSVNGSGGSSSATQYGNSFDNFANSNFSNNNYTVDVNNLFDRLKKDTTLSDYNKDVIKEILKLLEQLEELKKKLVEVRSEDQDDGLPWCSINLWKRDLRLGDEGEDVKMLQRFLNTQAGIKVATTGLGSPGQESIFFGLGTQQALIKFQEMHAEELLEPVEEENGTGYFGGLTKAFIKKQCDGDVSVASFGLNDVEKVEKQKVVLGAGEVGYDAWWEYRVTLKNGKIHKVRVAGTWILTGTQVKEAFRKVGYTDDIDDLLDKVVEDEDEDDEDDSYHFDVNDVESVVQREVDPTPGAVENDDEYTLYTITLESGRVIKVRVTRGGPMSMTSDAFRNAGYVGDVDDLIDMAEEEDIDTFGLSDIESVTREYVDPSQMMADEEYNIYTITLENGDVIEFTAAAFTYEGAFEETLREVGYTGDVDDFLDIVENVASENDFYLNVTTDEEVATARFEVVLANGCDGYEIDWDDGNSSTGSCSETGSSGVTQLFRTVIVEHEYQDEGEYEVVVTIEYDDVADKVATRVIEIEN